MYSEIRPHQQGVADACLSWLNATFRFTAMNSVLTTDFISNIEKNKTGHVMENYVSHGAFTY